MHLTSFPDTLPISSLGIIFFLPCFLLSLLLLTLLSLFIFTYIWLLIKGLFGSVNFFIYFPVCPLLDLNDDNDNNNLLLWAEKGAVVVLVTLVLTELMVWGIEGQCVAFVTPAFQADILSSGIEGQCFVFSTADK